MLDGLPGRQMAIDADLHAGLIDQHEAAPPPRGRLSPGRLLRGDGRGRQVRPRRRRRRRRDLLVNIVAGLYLGVVDHGMGLGRGGRRLHQADDRRRPGEPGAGVPDLAGRGPDRDPVVVRDRPRPRRGRPALRPARRCSASAAAFLVLLAFTALPKLPLLTLAGALGDAGRVLSLRSRQPSGPRRCRGGRAEPADRQAAGPVGRAGVGSDGGPAARRSARAGDRLPADRPGRPDAGRRPARPLRAVRQRVARELGLIVPQVRIRDEIGLGPHEYRVKIRGAAVGQGIAYAGRLLAVPPAGLVTRPDGRDGVDPVTGQPAVWIHADGREVAELAGCRILEASAVVAGHFGEIVADHADELMTHEQVGRLLDRARATVAGAGRRGRARPAPRRRGPARLAEPAPRAGQRPRPGDDPGDAGRARRQDQGHRRPDRARPPRPGAGGSPQQYRGPDGRLRVVTPGRALDARLAAAGGPGRGPARRCARRTTAAESSAPWPSAVGTLVETGLSAGRPLPRPRPGPSSRT